VSRAAGGGVVLSVSTLVSSRPGRVTKAPSGRRGLPRTAGVLGIGTALPDRVVSSTTIAERLGVAEDWIVARTGIRSRRIAGPDERLSDLATAAGAAALRQAGVHAADLDLVMVATVSADEVTPNTAPLVADGLGAVNAGALDVGAACTGFLSALALGAAWIEAGRATLVLVIGADTLSRFTDPDDRRTAALFGDGAGAVVLGVGQGGGLGPVVLHQDGGHSELIVAPRNPGLIEMDGQETFRHAVNRLVEVTHEALQRAGLSLSDIDLFVYHQANARITRAVGARLGIDSSSVVDCIAEQGNTSAATVPLALAYAQEAGRLRPGMTVLMAAFGAGLTWGGAVLEWGGLAA
jgi:3-oxoacyl-[acyl-carrier-protein] synthase III